MELLAGRFKRLFGASITFFVILSPLQVSAAKIGDNLAFPEKFAVRIASYSVQDADTDIAVFSSTSLGTGISFANDLGGDESATIPRIDAYYRFNARHRIDFAVFEIKRDGRKLLEIDVELADQTYSIGDTLVSDIDYSLFKVAYGYTLYHSSDVEIGVTAGLNITGYDFEYERADGSNADSSDVSAPLPMFGLRLSYAINDRWSLHYLSESFYIEVEDTLTGSFTTNEFDIQYRFNKSFTLGVGLIRFSTDLSADDSDWKGRIADTHRGLLVFASYML